MIKSNHQNYVTQTQYTKLRKALEAVEDNPDHLPEEIHNARVVGIKSQMLKLRQEMEDWTRHLIEIGEIY